MENILRAERKTINPNFYSHIKISFRNVGEIKQSQLKGRTHCQQAPSTRIVKGSSSDRKKNDTRRKLWNIRNKEKQKW